MEIAKQFVEIGETGAKEGWSAEKIARKLRKLFESMYGDTDTQIDTKEIKTSKYPINNENEQRAAKIALSQRMDEIDKKRSIGEDYMRYVDDKRKNRKKLAADDL